MNGRGIIRNRARACQVADFSGLQYGKATPSDIDGAMDFGGRAFVLFELKSGDTPLPTGQRILLKNMIDTLQRGGAAAVALVARHDAEIGTDINAAAATVDEIYHQGRWRKAGGASLRAMVDRFAAKFAPGELARLMRGGGAGQF